MRVFCRGLLGKETVDSALFLLFIKFVVDGGGGGGGGLLMWGAEMGWDGNLDFRVSRGRCGCYGKLRYRYCA